MIGAIFTSLKTSDFADHLRSQLDTETAQRERMQEWKANLATLDCKARYREKNRSLLRHKQAMRRAAEHNAIPPWLTKEHERRILRLHEKAVDREFWSKIPHDLHHSVPLCAKCDETGEDIACGMHVPWNLEVLPREENLNLGARFVGFGGFDADDGENNVPF